MALPANLPSLLIAMPNPFRFSQRGLHPRSTADDRAAGPSHSAGTSCRYRRRRYRDMSDGVDSVISRVQLRSR